ncbi:hypothetical protein BJ878DRAFT_567722 [Calycina marina]|uniref:Uncharacterized protein n=1 Tax=Calycina marina TaxID=1763456 RepID=A0A9P7Z285_9HELO|nr:hypothetical protein BJ878DRAFT_567722 [Calycina marina]
MSSNPTDNFPAQPANHNLFSYLYIMFWRRRAFIAILIALVSGLLLKFRRGSSSHEISSSSTAPSEPAEPATPYEAPFSNPNAPLEDDVIPGTYTIHLAPGYALDSHLATHHLDREHVAKILSALYKDKIVYTGTSISDPLLAKIRSDPHVSLISYEYLGVPGTSPSYLAPLEKCSGPVSERVEGAYQVLLAPDYGFESHSKVVGRDMLSLLDEKYNFHTNKWAYEVRGVDRGFLRDIRRDRGVELVVCVQMARRQTEGDLRPK